MSTNQKKNVLLGTPLEAAVLDPRWAAAVTLNKGSGPSTGLHSSG